MPLPPEPDFKGLLFAGGAVGDGGLDIGAVQGHFFDGGAEAVEQNVQLPAPDGQIIQGGIRQRSGHTGGDGEALLAGFDAENAQHHRAQIACGGPGLPAAGVPQVAPAVVAADLPAAVGLTVVGAVDLPEILPEEVRYPLQLPPDLLGHAAFGGGADVEAVEERPDQIVVPSGPLLGEQSGKLDLFRDGVLPGG